MKEFNSYKGDNVKTVVDAVNEFKGEKYNFEWEEYTDNRHCYIEVTDVAPDIKQERRIGQITDGGTKFNPRYRRLVCTKDQFNQCVSSMSHHAGSELYERYVRAIKTPLTKESKVDCKPVDATHIHDSGDYYKFTNMTAEVYHDGKWVESCFLNTELNSRPSFELLNKPVFTQEMSDANKLPSVGMEFMWTQWASEELKLVKMLAISGGECWIEIGDSSIIVGNITGCKPLTPPIQLEDGKAYQFKHKDKGLLDGTYDDNGKVFWSKSHPCHLGYCTNIKPLTVEGE